MTRVDNSHHLVRAALARHEAAAVRARAAIEVIDWDGQPLTFVAVARAAGVTRSWLYNQPELRDTILRLRAEQPNVPSVPSPERATTASLRRRLDDARDEVARLRSENAALRDQIARHLGEQRTRR